MIPKFRAWDKVNKKLKQVYSINFDKNGEIESIKEEYTEPNEIYAMFDIGYFELMQSTGLKDKDGTEIYEGDIVRYNRGVSYSVEKFPYSVKYIEGTFVLEHGFIQHNLFKNLEYVTVIGNVYENPDLLEDN